MIDILLKLAAKLDDLGHTAASEKVDNIVRKATKSPELAQWIEEMERQPGRKPLLNITHEDYETGTEKMRQERLEHYKTNPQKQDDWTRHPNVVSWHEVGRIHAEQDARRQRKDPIPNWPSVGPTSAKSLKPDALKSLLQYQEYGPGKGAEISLENALEFAKGYLSEEKDLSDDEKAAQTEAVRQAFSK